MKKVYLTEEQLKFLNEEEYTYEKRIGPFASEEEARAELLNLRRERGFSKYDSYDKNGRKPTTLVIG